jgi:hypothetical protein
MSRDLFAQGLAPTGTSDRDRRGSGVVDARRVRDTDALAHGVDLGAPARIGTLRLERRAC